MLKVYILELKRHHCVWFPHQINAILAITPNITLVCVRSVQDGFKSHPFYWHLWKKNVIDKVKKYCLLHISVNLHVT